MAAEPSGRGRAGTTWLAEGRRVVGLALHQVVEPRNHGRPVGHLRPRRRGRRGRRLSRGRGVVGRGHVSHALQRRRPLQPGAAHRRQHGGRGELAVRVEGEGGAGDECVGRERVGMGVEGEGVGQGPGGGAGGRLRSVGLPRRSDGGQRRP